MLKKFEYDNIPVVQTTAGYVKGYRYEGTYIFKGIPYAYADRFQMPVPPVSWEGVIQLHMEWYVHCFIQKNHRVKC